MKAELSFQVSVSPDLSFAVILPDQPTAVYQAQEYWSMGACFDPQIAALSENLSA